MQDGSSREDIAGYIDPLVGLHVDDFRGYESWGSASIEDIWLVLTDGRKSKINNDCIERFFRSEHNILKLDVPVHHSESMHVINTLYDILHCFFNLR